MNTRSPAAVQSNALSGADPSPVEVIVCEGDAPAEQPAEMVRREWKEITAEFFGCVKELQLGELIHDNMFGLFDAMSAIEMMDPKMDAGMCCNKEATPLNFQTAVEVRGSDGTIKCNS